MWTDVDVENGVAARSGPLRRSLARGLWRRDPAVRLHYRRHDDAIVVEILLCPAARSVIVHDRLLVEFDDTDGAALPATLCLTGVAADPASPALAVTRDLLGERVWAAAQELVTARGGTVDVELDDDEASVLESCWTGFAAWTREEHPVVGIEVLPKEVRAGVVDRRGRVFGIRTAPLDEGSPAEVVEAICGIVDPLGGDAPVALQIGGPVDSATGVVTYYAKQRRGRPWENVRLGDLLRARTQRDVSVFNDTQALAHWEVEFGLGTQHGTFALLLVGDGIGAKYVQDRAVQPHPMEIGVFVPNPWLVAPGTSGSIEAVASVPAMARRIADNLGIDVTTIADVAHRLDALADQDLAEKSVTVFREAAEDVARGMAAIQLLLNPRAWVVYLPAPLHDSGTAAGRAAEAGLRMIDRFVEYEAVRDPSIHRRTTDGPVGVSAATVALRAATAQRTAPAAGRAGEQSDTPDS
ncbi:ROK family protein [Pseudonocardia sp.]|uniref:ROK family protein n=1 Tax=Pseudonocardia sp. TaxID=60912 RepID=UPI003D0B6A5C